jgi:hypothetical protein
MPTLKLGSNSNSLEQVCRALETTAKLPPTTGGDVAWIRSLLVKINRRNQTDIVYDHEDFGYIFFFKKLSSSVLLNQIKTKHKL